MVSPSPLKKNARDKLAQYLNEVDPPKKVRITSKIGWQGTAFVLPDETLGKTDEDFLFKSDNYTSKFNVKGSLEDWKLHIAKRILGNSVPEYGRSKEVEQIPLNYKRRSRLLWTSSRDMVHRVSRYLMVITSKKQCQILLAINGNLTITGYI